jgi:hypothetical protein
MIPQTAMHLKSTKKQVDVTEICLSYMVVEYVSCVPTESARELFPEECEPVEGEQ